MRGKNVAHAIRLICELRAGYRLVYRTNGIISLLSTINFISRMPESGIQLSQPTRKRTSECFMLIIGWSFSFWHNVKWHFETFDRFRKLVYFHVILEMWATDMPSKQLTIPAKSYISKLERWISRKQADKCVHWILR